MRTFLLALTFFGLSACATHRTTDHGSFESAPSSIDQQRDPSIEDYILALPPFSFHEETVSSFQERVRTARALPENKGKNQDYLFVPGDGCWPAKEFKLERAIRKLTILVHPGPGPDSAVCTITMRRVSGGWIRGQTTPSNQARY